MKRFLTIKEFSHFSGIEQTTLRYWDEIELFSPNWRNPENNYRYYTPEQIITVKFISVLSSLNFPLKTISGMTDIRTPENIVRLIEEKEKELDMEMTKLRECYSIVHARLELIRYGIRLSNGYKALNGVRLDNWTDGDEGINVDETKICVLKRDEKTYILGEPNEYAEDEEWYDPFMRFCHSAPELRVNLHYPIGGYHECLHDFINDPGKPQRFFSLDPTGNRKRTAGDYLVGFKRGYYGDMGDLPERMRAYLQENSLKTHGPVYILYLYDEICMTDRSNYLAQISVAVSHK
ncbi:MAG: MerR family transcriptional regulator [Oscillospiraceae bacterium]|nr:MerR family transcriptional regulator [Oscillospiraceae bacterium]